MVILIIRRLIGTIFLQYGRFLKGIVLSAHYRAGPTVAYCPPPCFGYSFRNQLPVWPQMISDVPVTLLARATGIEPA